MILAVASGGALGALSRYGVSLIVLSFFGAGFQPLATLAVNALGSGIMGGAYALVAMGTITSGPLKAFIMVGFLGALTTFSSFSLDAINLMEKGMVILALGYILLSVLISLLCFVLAVGAVKYALY